MRSIRRIRRRDLLGASAAAGAAFAVPAFAKDWAPNEKLSIAGIGVGGQGGWDIGNCAHRAGVRVRATKPEIATEIAIVIANCL